MSTLCPCCHKRPINLSGYCDVCQPQIEQDMADVEANQMLLAFVAEFHAMSPDARSRIRNELDRRMS